MLVPWTPLTPSRRERAVRRIGVGLALAAAGSLLAAIALTEGPEPFTATAALLALLAAGGAIRARPAAPMEVGVDRSGALAVRRATAVEGGPDDRVHCLFAAPWLITLKLGTMLVPIWPDSVPGNTYRRLWVHIRWGCGRRPAELPAANASGDRK